MHHGRDLKREDERQGRKLRGELRGAVSGGKYGGVEAFGADEGGDVGFGV